MKLFSIINEWYTQISITIEQNTALLFVARKVNSQISIDYMVNVVFLHFRPTLSLRSLT